MGIISVSFFKYRVKSRAFSIDNFSMLRKVYAETLSQTNKQTNKQMVMYLAMMTQLTVCCLVYVRL